VAIVGGGGGGSFGRGVRRRGQEWRRLKRVRRAERDRRGEGHAEQLESADITKGIIKQKQNVKTQDDYTSASRAAASSGLWVYWWGATIALSHFSFRFRCPSLFSSHLFVSHDGDRTESSLPFACVCVWRERRAGCLLEIAIVAWLTHTHTHTRTLAARTCSCRSIKKERIKASQQANAPPELPLKVFVGGWVVCGYPSLAAPCWLLAARCSLLLLVVCVSVSCAVLFVLTHTHSHTLAHSSAHSATADYILRYGFFLVRGWPVGWLADCWSGHITV